MKILLTGASGFIGSAVAAKLKAAGHDLTMVSIHTAALITGNITGNYYAVIHCGWGGVAAGDRLNPDLQAANVEVFQRLIHEFLEHPPGVFISFGSQAEIYQSGTPYGMAKAACREKLAAMALYNGMRYLWLQLFSVYGPGEGDDWFIPARTRSLLANETMNLTTCEQELDYLHVDDVAAAVLAGINSDADGIYQVGTGNPVKLRTVVEKLVEITGSKSIINYGAILQRHGQVMRACADPTEFTSATGWKPTVDFDKGLRQTVNAIANRQSSITQ